MLNFSKIFIATPFFKFCHFSSCERSADLGIMKLGERQNVQNFEQS